MEDKKIEKKEEVKPEEVKEPTLLEKAEKTAERIEKANAEMKELLERQEKVESNKILGGRSEAGQATEKKEETPAEYAKRVMSGKV